MTQHMLLFSIGPIQTFITQARKTRDLWLGSFLLSKLMEAAMEGIDKQGTFVFPSEQKVDGWIPDLPNKYIAIFDNADDAVEAAGQSEENVKKHWKKICQRVWEKVIANHADEQTESIWNRQTNPDTLFEIYWAITQKREQPYKDWLEETEQLLAARKRLRNFASRNEEGEKSATSGDREVLRGKDAEKINAFWQEIAQDHQISPKDLDSDGKEHLDAIDTVKRFAMQAGALSPEQPFPSTSSIATASFIESLLGSNIDHQILRQWLSATDKLADQSPRSIPFLLQKAKSLGLSKWEWLLRRDGDLYFSSFFTPRQLEKSHNIKEPSEATTVIRNGQRALRDLLAATSTSTPGIARPTPYYAIVQMDGDKMGFLLSGVEEEDEHRNISATLSRFARQTVPPIVEEQYPGQLVYAGGDDVLALVPLVRDAAAVEEPKHVLDLVNRLQSSYCKEVRAEAQKVTQNKERLEGITASIGIAIAHHYTSLSYALRSAREAESLAKKRYGRNALVVTVLRRSGEQTRVGCHWYYPNLDADGQPIPLFSRFLTLFKEDALSPKCIYVLLEEAPILVGLDLSAQKSEIKRVLKRQSNDQKIDDGELDKLSERVSQLSCAIDQDNLKSNKEEHLSTELHQDTLRRGLVETLGWLLVMSFLARKDRDQE